MRSSLLATLAAIAAMTVGPAVETQAADTLGDELQREAALFRERQREAAQTLAATRDRVAQEKAPLLKAIRAAEERLLHAQSEARRLETAKENANELRRNVLKEIDATGKSVSYVNTLAHDALKTSVDAATGGEMQVWSETFENALRDLDQASTSGTPKVAVDTAELLLAYSERALGGYTAPGKAIMAGNTDLRTGTFALLGPETYFRSDDGAHVGIVRQREGSAFATAHAIAEWRPEEAKSLFLTGAGTMPADPSGGKALRLAETRGSLWQHIRKGGIVALAILLVGVVAVALMLQKTRQVLGCRMPDASTTKRFLGAIADNDPATAQAILTTLRGPTAELFKVGFEHRLDPKPTLEETLQSVLLEQRIQFERRLPLLAVIATAAPLMGLLGTVVGMVRTFALITVFGTGNAAKLSSGISEVLVATELGLVVAIPALIVHGFLAHRIQKTLGTLERHALQFVTAADAGRGATEAGASTSALVA